MVTPMTLALYCVAAYPVGCLLTVRAASGTLVKTDESGRRAMTFLSPAYLFGLMAIGIPLWLHLARRRKTVPIPFSSLRYLKLASARMQRQARLEDLWLLVLRCLVLVFLVLALARPVLPARHAFFGLGRPRALLVVIDATASMAWSGAQTKQGGSRLERSKALAADWLRSLPAADRVALWVVADKLYKPIPEPILDRQSLLDALSAVKQSHAHTSLAAVFAAARVWAAEETLGAPEMVLFTDNQAAVWDWDAKGFFASIWPVEQVKVTVIQPDDTRPANLAVQPVLWSSSLAKPGHTLRGVVKITNHADQAASDVLEIFANGKPQARETLQIESGGSIEIPLQLPIALDSSTIFSGSLSLSGDTYAADDTWHFAIPVQRTVRARILENTSNLPGRLRPSYYLERALAAGHAATTEVLDARDWAAAPLDGVDTLFVCGEAIRDSQSWEKAASFTHNGGTTVVFADTKQPNAPDWWPITEASQHPLPAGRIATRLLDPTHPLFAGLWHEQAPFPPLIQGTAWHGNLEPGARVLATLAGDLPFLVDYPMGRGHLMWINTSADRAWGDFVLTPVYLALMHQMARLGDLLARAPTQRIVGEIWPELAPPSVLWSNTPWEGAQNPAMADKTDSPGIFQARNAQLKEPAEPRWVCAVNVHRAESDLRPVERAAIAALLPASAQILSEVPADWQDSGLRQIPLWPILLLLTALAFLAESRLSARAARSRGGMVAA